MDDQYNNNENIQGENNTTTGFGFDSPQPENPYAQQSNPYGQEQQQANPYEQQDAQPDNPYAQQANPYGQQDAQQGNPYGQEQQQDNPYAQQSNPYGQEQQQGNPYGQQDAQQGNQYGQEQQQANQYGQQYSSYDQQSTYGAAYNSSNYSYQEMPEELRKWNWGAMMFNILWGIGNKAYMPLLCLIPCFGFIWMFVCGAKGNEWAWNAGTYKNIETFKAAQDSWNRAGFVSFIIWIAGIALYIISIIIAAAVGASMFGGLEDFVSSGGFDYYDFA